MSLEHITYRVRQFWHALTGSLAEEDWHEVQSLLTPAQLALFQEMSAAEQAHSLRVLRSLQTAGTQDQDLWTAALLHDVGKSRGSLSLWDRVWIVLAPESLSSDRNRQNSNQLASRQPLVVATEHAAWGAEMAARAGASSKTVWLIRHHETQDFQSLEGSPYLTQLQKLIEADNQN